MQIRAFRKRRDLRLIKSRVETLRPDDILLFSTVRNEHVRLPYFLEYYRKLGIAQFFIVDNGSTDGTTEFLSSQPDVTLYFTKASYKSARFGVDWLNWLQRKFGHGHWTLVVDADEFLVYPYCDTRPLNALTDWLDASAIKSFGTMVLDLYPKGQIDNFSYSPGQDPFADANWFDSSNYVLEKNYLFGNLWIQGGPRSRSFFQSKPNDSPALNKIPLVKWHRKYAYVSSTHMLLPRGLNLVYDAVGGEKASGCLLHAKFLDVFIEKSAEEVRRKQHYAASLEYRTYAALQNSKPDLWTPESTKMENWQQLEMHGLMSKGNWV